jgi:MFS family permease
MSKTQFFALFMTAFLVYFVGGGLMALLPVYLGRLGADPTQMGFYFAVAFAALSVSAGLAGRLSRQFNQRKPFIIAAGLLASPLVWLMGQAQDLLQLLLFTTGLWFAGGIIVTMVNILAGLFAEETERGRVFGILGLAIPLGGLLSGFASGYIADTWGYAALFSSFAVVYLGVPLLALGLQDTALDTDDSHIKAKRGAGFSFTIPFILLFVATTLAHIANAESILSRPLIMDSLNYDATAISIANAMGGLITLPLPLIIGWLSDRLGRRPLIIFCFLSTGIALAVLVGANELWHFWLSSALQTMLVGSIVVGSALVSDWYDKENLSIALSIFGASPWIGFVIGFSATGSSIQAFTMTPTLLAGVFLALIAALTLLFARSPRSILGRV